MMKKPVIIAAALLLILCIGGGVSLYFWPGLMGLAMRGGHKANEHEGSTTKPHAAERVPNTTIGKLVRELGEVQDRIALGKAEALADQQRQFGILADEFDQIDSGNWQSLPKTDDILVYVLSGGEPDVLRRFMAASPPVAAEKRVVESVLHFVDQNSREASASLGELNLLELRSGIAGPIALAKASLLAGTDDKKASAALDVARLVSPHSAIEEAALRRQIPLLFAEKNYARGLQLMVDYVSQYGESLYAPKFYHSVSLIVVQNDKSDGTKFIDGFADAVDGVGDQVASDVLLSFARTFLAQGRLTAAKLTAGRTLMRANASEANKSRARLYLAAAEAPSEKAGEVATALAGFDDRNLSEEDQGIRRVAGDIARSIVSEKRVVERVQGEPSTGNDGASQSTVGQSVPNGSPLPRAEQLLMEIEKLSQPERL